MLFRKKRLVIRQLSCKRIAAACIFFSLGVFLTLIVLTYNPHDPSWFYFSTDAQPISNGCGALGANGAALLFYLFGSSSLLISLLFFFVAYSLLQNRLLEWDRIGAFVLLPFVCAALYNFFLIDFLGSPFPGGLIGSVLHVAAVRMFDEIGALFFLLSVGLICFFLAMRIPFVAIGHYSLQIISFVFSKDAFLLPLWYRIKKVVYAITSPLRWSIIYLHHLFNGSRITEAADSIVAFEQGNDDDVVDISDDLFWQRYLEKDNGKCNVPDIQQKSVAVQMTIGNQPTKKQNEIKKEKKQLYTLPSTDMFVVAHEKSDNADVMSALEKRARVLEEKLERFGVFGSVISIKRGPVVTLFEYQPHIDSKISKIIALEDDLAMALQALSIRIIAPIPGRSVVGFEVANTIRNTVLLADVIKSKLFRTFSGWLPLILGQDTVGNNVVVDLAKMPHLLIAGSTGSGKSVALNAMLVSLLCKCKPDELKLILIDPKRLEFASYADIAHLLFPIVTQPKQAGPVLKWVVKRMEERYEMMTEVGARNIFDYNVLVKNNDSRDSLPFIVVVIDELSDLMMTVGKEIEDLIARITQMARAAGIHMIVATQRPSVDVITGLIKVNFPSRISFRVTSKIDSRTILDCGGADKLLGRGDMLFLDSHESLLKRVHGAYLSNSEIQKLVAHIRAKQPVQYQDITEDIIAVGSGLLDADDELYKNVLSFLEQVDEVSISLLQRRFRIGYNRSARIIDMLESQGLIAPSEGGKTRRVIR